MSDEAIMDRIAKLMAKAKGTSNEHEAAIFAEKAAELLAEHNLTEEMLAQRDVDREQGPVGTHKYNGRAPDQWRVWILQGTARLYFCHLIATKTYNGKVYEFIGREHNAKVAQLMSDYLIATVKRMAREYSPHKPDQGDFRKGAGLRLHRRLYDLYEQQNTKVPTEANPDNLPALYASESQAVEEYLRKQFPNLRAGKTGRPVKMGEGARAGMAAADRIGLNTQVRETRASRMIGA